ncbi:hypothetical protein BY996DRAFT_6412809 [Phakopsora pachyrhizi]|uniref:Expressed protein n=1 Tax=Phakopsora pachyrhizi TaxID=170000 RepID=A0AAV0BPK2_PHAPC|nr:hypothetical protein BY996DRAFT_6412809 [Phakopsora pachyrhizi]CAH7688109.1 expressed protein [Phakopsora pachyrhizi]
MQLYQVLCSLLFLAALNLAAPSEVKTESSPQEKVEKDTSKEKGFGFPSYGGGWGGHGGWGGPGGWGGGGGFGGPGFGHWRRQLGANTESSHQEKVEKDTSKEKGFGFPSYGGGWGGHGGWGGNGGWGYNGGWGGGGGFGRPGYGHWRRQLGGNHYGARFDRIGGYRFQPGSYVVVPGGVRISRGGYYNPYGSWVQHQGFLPVHY